MGKRLTPEERAARIKEYEEAKATRQAARLEKRKARVEAYEKAKAERAKRKEWEKRGVKPVTVSESSKVGQVKRFPTYKGEVKVGDWVGFRWLGMAMEGKVEEYSKERNYRLESDEIAEAIDETRGRGAGFTEFYCIRGTDGSWYPIKRVDILAKKINGRWIDSCN